MLITALRLAVALADSAIAKVRERRARARARDNAADTRRQHSWTLPLWDGYEQSPPLCVYCTTEQTPLNEHMLCPATGKASR